uniref:DUF3465 domain-containing protein n=1 Tax=Aliarcobacter sp. TaxID=2321116 RepID=UPI004047A70F
MRKLLFTIFTCLCLLSNITYANDNNIINKAYHNKQSDVQVQGIGKVIKVLKDDTKGSKHQRFLVKLPSGLTILIAHNIDLAPRVQNLKSGDSIEFYGEYEWNNKGGVIHWTHHDPRKKHKDGWIKHKQIVYK